jgi:hypothetical protein
VNWELTRNITTTLGATIAIATALGKLRPALRQ